MFFPHLSADWQSQYCLSPAAVFLPLSAIGHSTIPPIPRRGLCLPYEDWLRQYFYPHDVFSASFGRLANPMLPIPRHGSSPLSADWRSQYRLSSATVLLPPFGELDIAQLCLSFATFIFPLLEIGRNLTSPTTTIYPLIPQHSFTTSRNCEPILASIRLPSQFVLSRDCVI